MKEKIIKKEDLPKYYIGVDLAYRLKWWQRLLVWLGFRNRWQDYSASVVFKDKGDGTVEVVDVNYF